jgi:glycosyltransferase involved in cell wall biosynthesis
MVQDPIPQPTLSIVFPAYNEEDNVEAAVEGVRRVLEPAGVEYEIIIVDDCSTDRTPALADELALKNTAVRVIHHERNYKLGRSIRTGFAAATKALVFYTDADLPIDFADIPRGIQALRDSGADAVIGYRLDRGGEPAYRVVYSFIYNRLVNILFGLRVRDVNFSYKLVKRELLKRLELTSEGSFIDAELLARIKAAGGTVAQLGVRYYARRAGESTLARPAVIAKIFKEMFHFWRTFWLRRRPGADN